MKHYFFCSLFFLLIFSELCYGLKTPKIIFDKKVCDFGIVKYKANSIIKIKFYYKNTGDAPLVIYNVNASCGCTVPGWTKKPISVGTRDYISVVFKMKDKIGNVRKSLFINTNCFEKDITLCIKGIIN